MVFNHAISLAACDMNAAREALVRGDLRAAEAAARSMVADQARAHEGFFLLAMVAAERGEISRALAPLQQALALSPDQPEYRAQYARLLILLHRDQEAASVARAAVDGTPGDARTMDTLGCVLARLGDHAGSLPLFEAAVAQESANLSYRYNLAAACGFNGLTDQARGHYEAILVANPGDARTHYAVSILSRQTATSNHVARLEAALARPALRPAEQVRIGYALAKELEDLGEAHRAFAALTAANTIQKRLSQYDFARDAAIFDAIEAHAAGRSGDTGLAGERPIFIVGMPRTGTTLVDRILSSHPDVGSAGELQAMPLAIKQAAGTTTRTVLDPDTVGAAAAADPARIGTLYLQRAEQHRPVGSARFIDKLPANFLNIGAIAGSLPDATIVCLRRGAMDTVWANYRNLFATASPFYAYSWDLMDTARYYLRFDRLMARWEQLLPGRVLQFSYEDLVDDQEAQTRRLLDHCGLEWDPACLAFHENRSAVATPSAAQVRRTLNRDGIGRWRTHEAGFADVAAFFTSNGIPVS